MPGKPANLQPDNSQWTLARILDKIIDKPYIWRTHYVLKGVHHDALIMRAPGENGTGTQIMLRLILHKEVQQIAGPGTFTETEAATWFGLLDLAQTQQWVMETPSNIVRVPGPGMAAGMRRN